MLYFYVEVPDLSPDLTAEPRTLMRQAILLTALVAIPTALSAQSLAPPAAGPRSLAIPSALACASDCRPSAVLAAARQAPARLVEQDPIDHDRSGVMYGAAIGGMVGGAAAAIYTLWDNQEAPLSWWEALAAPVAGALVGAGIGLLF